jgi:Orthopoxvirus protein of unknown function (DUF830).
MNRCLFMLLLAVAFVCCDSSPAIRSGDLVFVGLSSGDEGAGSMSSAITSATGGEGVSMTHVGILECSDDTVWVIDATPKHGVSRRTLDDFRKEALDDNPASVFRIVRVGADSLSYRQLEGFVENAKKLIGASYDFTFLPGNGMYYCSELVYSSYTVGEEHIFKAVPMNFKSPDGTFPEFWVGLFDSLGMEIPQDKPGTNPQDMYKACTSAR